MNLLFILSEKMMSSNAHDLLLSIFGFLCKKNIEISNRFVHIYNKEEIVLKCRYLSNDQSFTKKIKIIYCLHKSIAILSHI